MKKCVLNKNFDSLTPFGALIKISTYLNTENERMYITVQSNFSANPYLIFEKVAILYNREEIYYDRGIKQFFW